MEENSPSTGTELKKVSPQKDGGSTAEGLNSGGYNKSTEMLVEDNDYDQLPPVSRLQPSSESDYDQLPALAYKNGSSR